MRPQKKQPEKYFLCCFCGIFIKKNKNNLDRHERIHVDKVKKYKCCAENCESTFINKENYYDHWKRQHRNIVIPDCLNIIYEEPKLKKRQIERIKAETQTEPFRTSFDYGILESVGLIQKFNVKIENSVLECLKANPFFGELK